MPAHLRRYHFKIWFPEDIDTQVSEFFNQFDRIQLTNHAQLELTSDKRGDIPIPTKNDIMSGQVIEVYQNLNKMVLQKVVIRVHDLNKNYDYTYVVAREGVIVSAWANSKTDIHRIVKSFNKFWAPENLRSAIRSYLKKEDRQYIKLDFL